MSEIKSELTTEELTAILQILSKQITATYSSGDRELAEILYFYEKSILQHLLFGE